MKVIDISTASREPLNIMSSTSYRDMTEKGWSYSGVYSLEELRDVYMLLRSVEYVNLKEFTCLVKQKVIAHGSKWTERRVLEILNAIVNFKWLTKDSQSGSFTEMAKSPLFETRSFGNPISENDKVIFRSVFFEYSRFREFIQLYFLKKYDCYETSSFAKNTQSVFSIRNNKYTDTFFSIVGDSIKVKFIENEDREGKKNTPCMMFWDVFTTWGRNLNLIEFLKSDIFDVRLQNGKSFTCSYFPSNGEVEIPTLKTIIDTKKPNQRIIDINFLTWILCTQYRMPIENAKDYIIDQYENNKRIFSLVRTSEIFINKSDKRDDSLIPYPKYNSSYISHLIIKGL